MAKRRSARTAVVEIEEAGEFEAAGKVGETCEDYEGEAFHDPLYPVALLKIAMAMKDLDPEATLVFDQLLDEVLDDMVIDREEFRRYLQRNMGRLIAAVKLRGY